MANVSYRLGTESEPEAMKEAARSNRQLSDAFERFQHHLGANGIDIGKTPAVLGPWVTLDSGADKFVGEFANEANAISRREYREPFVVPEMV